MMYRKYQKLSRTIKTGKDVDIFGRDDYQRLQQRAYRNKRGYAIGDVAGEKTMVVSGSRNVMDWALNFGEFGSDVSGKIAASNSPFPRTSRLVTERIGLKYNPIKTFARVTRQRLQRIADKNKVINIVGHSRGARLISEIKGDYNKAGIDGAMIIAPNKQMRNFAQDRGLDVLLAYGGKKNTWVNQGRKFGLPRNQHFLASGFKKKNKSKYNGNVPYGSFK